ncbi:hypothetical protein [Alkalihalobacterium elongatum]|uniref:hypothetical protein n=1 Tax=Alkalihalobacterium elongatum TaxID=2675466 RepID=UPI001C1F8CD2|nr:hypothetical protein [Alkalihalobacterium elongatum]
MACVTSDGNLTSSAKDLLQVIQHEALSADQIAKKINMPLFKVRSNLRDMASMGFVIEENESYKMNPKVEKLLN